MGNGRTRTERLNLPICPPGLGHRPGFSHASYFQEVFYDVLTKEKKKSVFSSLFFSPPQTFHEETTNLTRMQRQMRPAQDRTDFVLQLWPPPPCFMYKGDCVVRTIHLANTHSSPARPAAGTEKCLSIGWVSGWSSANAACSPSLTRLRSWPKPENKGQKSRFWWFSG